MKIISRIFLALCTLMAEASCATDSDEYALINDFPIPQEAYEIKKIRLGKGNTEQLFFVIPETYPSTRIIDSYKNLLTQWKWVRCGTSVPHWSSYEDTTEKQHLLVHKLTDYWVFPKEHKLLILSAVYHSQDLSKIQPDNENQKIIVWVQETRDLRSELKQLKVSCNVPDDF